MYCNQTEIQGTLNISFARIKDPKIADLWGLRITVKISTYTYLILIFFKNFLQHMDIFFSNFLYNVYVYTKRYFMLFLREKVSLFV